MELFLIRCGAISAGTRYTVIVEMMPTVASTTYSVNATILYPNATDPNPNGIGQMFSTPLGTVSSLPLSIAMTNLATF